MKMRHKDTVWHDRKRNFLGLPWTFTVYELDENRLFIDTGIFNSREDEVRLYRITDITLTRSLWQKITGTGTLHVDSADATMKNFDIKNVKESVRVREALSDYVERARLRSRVYAHETVNNHSGIGMPNLGAGVDLDGDGIPDDVPLGVPADEEE